MIARSMHYFARRCTIAVLAVTAATISGAAGARADAPFAGLHGSWSGSGTANFEGGRRERITCRAYYGGGGSSINLSLRCATQSTQVNLQGSLAASGNRVHGDWTESSFGASGSAAGNASGGTMRLRLSGGASGTLVVSTSGSSQSVSISTNGVALQGVSISMHRR